MSENVQKFVRKRKKVDNFIYARGKRLTIVFMPEKKRLNLLINIAYVRGIAGGAFRGRRTFQLFSKIENKKVAVQLEVF